jgi:integrase
VENKKTKRKSGSIITKNGKLYARIRFTDDSGKQRDLWRAAKNRKDAQEKIKGLLKDAENKTSQEFDASRMKFDQLADWYSKTYLHEAIYINDRKISGIRNIKPSFYNLQCLRSHFGNQLIQLITHSDILNYKLKCLNTPLKNGGQRGITGVNRKLQLLRRLFSLCVKNGWIKKNPFHNGDALISMADEIPRTRILSFTEEIRLFAAIESNPQRFWLKGAVLIALDCSLRKSEILSIKRKDINFDNKILTIRALNTKTLKARTVGLTQRVYSWLLQFENYGAEDEIFPIKTINTTWQRTIKQAKIDDFNFHDLRATCISRLLSVGLQPVEVMRISGHSNINGSFFRYVRADETTYQRAASALESYLVTEQIKNNVETSVFIN